MKTLRLTLLTILLLFFSICSYAQPSFEGEKKLLINGTEIFINIIGQGEPLLIVHGGPGLAHDYLFEPFKQLADKYKLIFYDQRGCGRSAEFKNDETISMEILVEDLEELRKELKIDKLNLVGQSWGAIIALNYSFKYGQNVKKLLLLEPAPGSSEYLPLIQKTIFERLSAADKEKFIRISQSPNVKTNPEVFKEFMAIRTNTYFFDTTFAKLRHFDYFDSMRVTKFFASSAMFFSYLMNYNLYGNLKNIKCPTLIIHGEYDVIPTSAIEKMNSEIRGCETHIRVLLKTNN